ncbi:ectomycorrhiza-regulated esterase [Desarmillaria tabescens]|uniref:Ectomycorrhiza-regulated esterase n=1 Tax=Armillaria tabescens TaxID=1929756 RepID=A0AA39MPJ9_ARMTA|nr:ectomycorrhiza-regulated esterase [Desarmillaria tabescens]KAK0441528.1 ectomycorrhiza-regulated esterase [Desarmillaria tabescens]
MPERTPSEIFIPSPHPGEPSSITGILEQLGPGKPTDGRKLALVRIASHKDYLFLKRLATTLPMDTFRFDFRGHFESPGIWRPNSLEQDVLDLRVVTDYLTAYFGYRIDLIVAHSHGAILAVHWLCTTDAGGNVSGFVNVSGRYRMRVGALPHHGEGNVKLNMFFAGYLRSKIYPEDVDKFANFDGSLVETRFPKRTDVLTIHGMHDKTVPVYDAVLYAKTLSNRSPGTHSLHLMEHTDHYCNGRHDEVIQTILGWWDARLKGKLQSGVWKGTYDLRGKL